MTQPINKELLSRDLPKWPQMLVTGQSVTPEQAKEIIFRTDSFLTDSYDLAGGNNKDFTEWYQERAGLDRYVVRDWQDQSEEAKAKRKKNWPFGRLVRERIGHIDTSYVSNDWASCCFVWGAHGWCSPEGRIHFVDNVGKWPAVEDVLNDWTSLAKEFPFLDLTATLMSGEGSEEESVPVVNIVVRDGTAWLEEGNTSVHRRDVPHARNWDDLPAAFTNPRKELGLPDDWYGEYADRVRVITDSITEADLESED